MSVLPTQNKKDGFWGTALIYFRRSQVPLLWNQANKTMQSIGGLSPENARLLLDSCFGKQIVKTFKKSLKDNNFLESFAEKYSCTAIENAFQYYVGIWDK